MHLSRRAQITHLKADKALTKVLSEYADFANIFSLKLAVELLKHTEINDHTIKLVDNWQFLYGLIYSLSFIELETLKVYIEKNLANGFIWPSKSPIRVPIFFNKKLNKNLKLCINY